MNGLIELGWNCNPGFRVVLKKQPEECAKSKSRWTNNHKICTTESEIINYNNNVSLLEFEFNFNGKNIA